MPDTRQICHVHRKDPYRRGPGKLLEVMGSVRDPAGGKDPPAVGRILPHEFKAETAIGARYHDRGHSIHLVWSRSPAGDRFVNEDPVRSITRWRAHDRILGHRAAEYEVGMLGKQSATAASLTLSYRLRLIDSRDFWDSRRESKQL